VSKYDLCSHTDSKHSLPFLTMQLDRIPPSIAVKMCFKFRPHYSPLYSERDPAYFLQKGLVGLMSRYGLLAKDEILDSNTDSGDRSHCVNYNEWGKWAESSNACWLVYTHISSGLTFTNSTFCPHSVFMCFVWI